MVCSKVPSNYFIQQRARCVRIGVRAVRESNIIIIIIFI